MKGERGAASGMGGVVHAAPPLIAELLAAHAEEVGWLRRRVHALGHVVEGESWGSDVWLLKYVLSFVVRARERKQRGGGAAGGGGGGAAGRGFGVGAGADSGAGAGAGSADEARLERAVEGFGKMAAYRREHAALLEAVRQTGSVAGLVPQGDLIQRCCVVGVFDGGRSVHGAPLFLVRAGLSNPRALMDRVEERHMVLWMLMQRERMLVDLERAYAETGRLAGVINVNDLNGVSFWSSTDSRFQRMLSQVSRLSSFYYPMLIERNVVVNPPYFFRAVFRVVRPLMSARVLSKLSVCPGFAAAGKAKAKAKAAAGSDAASDSVNSAGEDGGGFGGLGAWGGDVMACPYASRAFRADALPTFLGGTNPVGIAGCSNDARYPAPDVEEGGIESVVVSAGRKHEVAVDVGADGWRTSSPREGSDDSEGGAAGSSPTESDPDGGGGAGGETGTVGNGPSASHGRADGRAVAGAGAVRYNLEYEIQVEAHSIEASVWFRAGFPALGGRGKGGARPGMSAGQADGAEQLHLGTHRASDGWCRGTVGIPGPGVAWLVFSNASSRFTSKTVRFRHAVVPIDTVAE